MKGGLAPAESSAVEWAFTSGVLHLRPLGDFIPFHHLKIVARMIFVFVCRDKSDLPPDAREGDRL